MTCVGPWRCMRKPCVDMKGKSMHNSAEAVACTRCGDLKDDKALPEFQFQNFFKNGMLAQKDIATDYSNTAWAKGKGKGKSDTPWSKGKGKGKGKDGSKAKGKGKSKPQAGQVQNGILIRNWKASKMI